MPLEDLPMLDEHSVEVAAGPDVVFRAIEDTFARVLSLPLGNAFARVWRCEPPSGFAVVDAQCPYQLVLAGRHRFSGYGIVFRIIPTSIGSTLSAESRAEFPGVSGRAYRTAVIGSGAHVVAMRRMLRRIAATAEDCRSKRL